MNHVRDDIPPLPELKLIAVDPGPAGLEGPRMSYMEAGAANAEPVVLLHGIGSNSTGWRYVLAALAKRYRVIAWNAPGYYLSDNFTAETPTHTQYAQALAALLDALGIGSAHIAGSSFGSLIAASLASSVPDRVRRLALLGTTRGQAWLPPEERARRLAMRAASIREGGLDLAQKRWANLVAANAAPTTIALVQQVLAATHPRGMMQAARTSDTTDVISYAPGIKAPTLLIVGTEDRVNPPEISGAIAQIIAGSKLVELEGVGHLAKLEAPVRTIELLTNHFST
jgi:pimeloyl-ACP methyl ester carboxylesterase